MTNGRIGDEGCDGWVSWTTNDDDNSYLPALHCGAFDLVIGTGRSWGASKDQAGVLFVVGYGDEGSDELASLDFDWHLVGFEKAVEAALMRVDHPIPGNVLEAARELWTALMFDGAIAGARSS